MTEDFVFPSTFSPCKLLSLSSPQVTALNHVKTAGLLGDGFGSTPEMCKKNLRFEVTRMQVVVDRYPTWGDVVQVETWVSASGKNDFSRTGNELTMTEDFVFPSTFSPCKRLSLPSPQVTALNHVKTAGLLGDGFGSTPEISKKNLRFEVTRMHVVVDRYSSQ